MKKGRAFAILLLAALVVISLSTYGIYRMAEERLTPKLTIYVKNWNYAPISSTIIRLESENNEFAVQNVTDSNGAVSFVKLHAGTYRLRATQLYCEMAKREPQTISVIIRSSNREILYTPC